MVERADSGDEESQERNDTEHERDAPKQLPVRVLGERMDHSEDEENPERPVHPARIPGPSSDRGIASRAF